MTKRLSAGPAVLLLFSGQFGAGDCGGFGSRWVSEAVHFDDLHTRGDSEHVGTAASAEVQSAAASGRILNPCGRNNANHSRGSNYISSCCPGGC